MEAKIDRTGKMLYRLFLQFFLLGWLCLFEEGCDKKPKSGQCQNLRTITNSVTHAATLVRKEENKVIEKMTTLHDVARTNFTLETVRRYADLADAGVPSHSSTWDTRRNVAAQFAEGTAKLILPRLVELESVSKFTDSDISTWSNRLTTICSLVERQWKNSIDSKRILRVYEMGWVVYLKRESRRRSNKGDAAIASLLSNCANRLAILAEASSGPVKASFDIYRQALNECPQENEHVRVERLKAYLNSEVIRGLGFCPQWAKEWLEKQQ